MKFKSVSCKKEVDIPLEEHSTVIYVKRLIEQEIKVAAKSIKLIHNNEVLDDNAMITEYGCSDSDTLLYCEIPKDETDNQLIVLLHSDTRENLRHIQIRKDNLLSQVKSVIRRLFPGIRCEMIFDEDGCELLDYQTVAECNLIDDSNIFLFDGLMSKQVLVTSVLSLQECLKMEVNLKKRVSDLKVDIARKLNLQSDDLALIYDNECMDEEKGLLQYYLKDSCMIRYVKLFGFDEVEHITDLNRGLFCTVFKCIQKATKKTIALKKYKLTSTTKLESYKGLLSEIITYQKLGSHPRIVDLIGLYKDKNAFCVGMEYMSKGSLKQYLDSNRLDDKQIFVFLKQILEGLVFIHENRVIHRDIRSASVLLDDHLNVKLSNFGLSKYLMGYNTQELLKGIDQTKNKGTYNWMAPEIVNGERYGSPVDIWSLGATIVEMLTGKPPYDGMESLKIVLKIGTSKKLEYEEPDRPVSEHLRSILDWCLKPNPSERPVAKKLLEMI